jgi:nucleoside-diphosphate kinase
MDEPWRRRVIAIVYQGPDAIQKIREIAGPTNPHVARMDKPGCIRALGTVVPLKDAHGNVIGERMDNLIHASANAGDAEREIKLWFKPGDIPPLMHAYATEVSEAYYCVKDNRLYTTHVADSICLLTPGDIAWKSDIDTLRQLSLGASAASSLESVAAKYLVNDYRLER